ncbi:protein indeterminate-domain 7 [Mercurialis annua]|uniref:protein indeterminate-domain 7 n=1 Tax=Mercurialis annua TaxID=3986 RepID=UPI00215EE847|nr:protein indeterminate-domain 7 [Mercurialis annua]
MMKDLMFHQQQQQNQEENMSNLTSASSVSSGNRNESNTVTNYPNPQQYFTHPQPSQSQPPLKKKRNLPGNPDPDSEVIALSPKTLMATNRFLCEICNKGFQRDQNLQLHRRGHNLPWKLKQRANKEVIRKKVYVCPEVTCVHHDPSRALGDLTGVKKHFSRKHGEKKWKCDKCSKKYAVQSDWKAHSKTCGTREYRCDCGTLFSRRDSFITHRAFCDALAEESARNITAAPPNPLMITQASAISSNLHQMTQFNNQELHAFSLKKEQQIFTNSSSAHLRQELPPWLAYPPPQGPPPMDHHHQQQHHHNLSSSSSSNFVNHQDLSSANPNPNLGPTNLTHYQAPPAPHMSATALLQKAAQMGATMSSNNKTTTAGFMIRPHHVTPDLSGNMTSGGGFGLNLSSRDHEQQQLVSGSSSSSAFAGTNTTTNGVLLQEMMNSLSSGFHQEPHNNNSFEDAFVSGVLNNNSNSKKDDHISFLDDDSSSLSKASTSTVHGGGGGGDQGLTRDFLGLRAFSHSDILSMAGLGNCVNTTASHEQQQTQKSWRG